MGFFISILHNKISIQFNNYLMISATAAKQYEKNLCNMSGGIGAPLKLIMNAYIHNGGKCYNSARCL